MAPGLKSPRMTHPPWRNQQKPDFKKEAPSESCSVAILRSDDQFSDSLVHLGHTMGPWEIKKRLENWTGIPYQSQLMADLKGMSSFAMPLQAAVVSSTLSYQERRDLLLLVLSPSCAPNSKTSVRDVTTQYIAAILSSGRLERSLLERAWLPTLTFLTSEVLLSWLNRGAITELYGAVDENILQVCKAVGSATWLNSSTSNMIAYRTYKTFYLLLKEYATRFYTHIKSAPVIQDTIRKLSKHIRSWQTLIEDTPQTLLQSVQPNLFTSSNASEHQKLLLDLDRDFEKLDNQLKKWGLPSQTSVLPTVEQVVKVHTSDSFGENKLASHRLHLESVWKPPGGRHSNDHPSISDIQIFPPTDELLCDEGSCLPANFPLAPHHVDTNGVARQLDTCFRLMREDFIAPIRNVVKGLQNKLNAKREELLQASGRLKIAYGDSDTICNIFHDASVDAMGISSRNNDLSLAASATWTKSVASLTGTGDLQRGALVGFMEYDSNTRPERNLQTSFHLGLLDDDVKAKAGRSGRISLHIVPLQIETYAWALEQGKKASPSPNAKPTKKILFTVPGVLVNIQTPYLEALTKINELQVPFGRYLQAPMPDAMVDMKLLPPSYTSCKGFSWNLSRLLSNDATKSSNLSNDSIPPNRPIDFLPSAANLTKSGKLDHSQAEALMHCLSSELALVEGPPGTGKSYVGLQIVQTLIDSGIKPIEIVCKTNHALDQFIEMLLKQGVTRKIVRLGNRSKSDIVRQCNLNERGTSRFTPGSRFEIRCLRDKMRNLCVEIEEKCGLAFAGGLRFLPRDWLMRKYPYWYREITNPPTAVKAALEFLESSGWKTVESSGRFFDTDDSGVLTWLAGREIEARARILEVLAKKDSEASQDHLENQGHSQKDNETVPGQEGEIAEQTRLREAFLPKTPPASMASAVDEQWLKSENPTRSWDADEISYQDLSVWELSPAGRQELCEYWLERAHSQSSADLVRLRSCLKSLNDDLQAIYDSEKVAYLKSMDIIAATTTGAATYLNLLQSAAPKVFLVEEAGEVLEGQLWATLTPSVQQMILIGDHKQLRPQVNLYHLSMDSKQGQYYRADQSLFERLVGSDMKFACLEIQRRMRPAISRLIKPLYPKLQDHPSTSKFSNINGIQSNVIFMSHKFPEDKEHAGRTSHSNTKEAAFAAELTKYLVYQGYGGRISIITPYVKQVAIIREHLVKAGVQLKENPTENHNFLKPGSNPQELTRDNEPLPLLRPQARIACVDNFQGEEDDIIILSLVRNSNVPQGSERRNPSIGFLRSPNRTNVALSRARHGLFILGDAELLQTHGSNYWKTVICGLKSADLIREGMPIICKRHPSERSLLKGVEDFEKFTPEAGCRRPCGTQRPCGHICGRQCHPDDSEHEILKCKEPCDQLLKCGHPCSSLCHQPKLCLPCSVLIKDLVLPCGHTSSPIACGQHSKLDKVFCGRLVHWWMPCGHSKMSPCSLVRDKKVTDDCHCPRECGQHVMTKDVRRSYCFSNAYESFHNSVFLYF